MSVSPTFRHRQFSRSLVSLLVGGGNWLLCDIQLSGIAAGLFQGRMAIFAEDGTLLATAGQSGVVRLLD